MAGDFGDLIDQSANLRTLAPAAVGTQVALMSIVSVSRLATAGRASADGAQAATIIVFNILRPRNKVSGL